MSDDYDYSKDNLVLDDGDDSDVEISIREFPEEKKQPATTGDGELSMDNLFSTAETDKVEFMAVKPWKGAIVAPSNPPANNPAPPSADLDLKWAFGYKAYEARNNVFYNSQGHIVYPVAGLVVVYDSKQHKQSLFHGMNDDVTCLAQSPSNGNVFAAGQVATVVGGRSQQPHICVFDSTDFEQCWVIKNATQRAVRALCFSPDGSLLACVGNDDNQTVHVYDWKAGKLLASAKGDTNKITDIAWNPKNAGEFVTVGVRHIFLWTYQNGALKKTKGKLEGKYPWQNFYSVSFSEKGYPCVSAYDGSVYVFVGGYVKKVVPAHKGKALTVATHANGIVTGGADKKVVIFDSALKVVRTLSLPSKVIAVSMRGTALLVGTADAEIYEVEDYRSAPEDVATLMPVVRGHFEGELWAAAPTPDGKSFITAGEDNRVFFFDIPTRRILREGIINDKAGPKLKIQKASTMSRYPPNQMARAIAVSPDGKEFIIGTNAGEVSIYSVDTLDKLFMHDINNYGKRKVIDQKENWIQTLAYSPDGQMVAVGTHGSVIVLLDRTKGYKPVGTLTAHNSFLTHIDWSEDGEFLQSNCGAYELLFHSVNRKNPAASAQHKSASALRDVKWATQTCTFGWPVQGVFEPGQDGTDVNAVDASPSRELLVSGDDYGAVNLYRYPVAAEHGNQKKTYVSGHSSHVMTVKFTPDEKWVISTGGNDKSVMLWRVKK